ncbi:hypothetical protein T492DRAFT_1058501 [Pavlovales sp. CCMP2436]|nr:hypothetical protein T492DRAFT_1058501 [Pavlovales sp. CCMP2436]
MSALDELVASLAALEEGALLREIASARARQPPALSPEWAPSSAPLAHAHVRNSSIAAILSVAVEAVLAQVRADDAPGDDPAGTSRSLEQTIEALNNRLAWERGNFPILLATVTPTRQLAESREKEARNLRATQLAEESSGAARAELELRAQAAERGVRGVCSADKLLRLRAHCQALAAGNSALRGLHVTHAMKYTALAHEQPWQQSPRLATARAGLKSGQADDHRRLSSFAVGSPVVARLRSASSCRGRAGALRSTPRPSAEPVLSERRAWR